MVRGEGMFAGMTAVFFVTPAKAGVQQKVQLVTAAAGDMVPQRFFCCKSEL